MPIFSPDAIFIDTPFTTAGSSGRYFMTMSFISILPFDGHGAGGLFSGMIFAISYGDKET